MKKSKKKKKPALKTPKGAPSAPKEDLRQLAFPQHLAENKIIEDLRDTVERLRIFDSLGKTLTSHLDLSEILRLVMKEFGALIGADHLCLVLLDNRANEFYFQFPESTRKNKRSYPVGQGLMGKCIEKGRAQLFDRPQKEAGFDSEIDGALIPKPGSSILLPILSKGSVLGALSFVNEENGRLFTPENLRSIESFADYLAIAVENATNYQKVQDLTITDDLTQLYNSRYLPVVLEREMARAKRYNEALSLVFIDLDNFKSVNDNHGHLAGSAILTEFGDFLFHHIRTTDVGIRYGGDEFVLVLPRTSQQEAVRVVERAIDELRGKVFLKSRNLNIQVTASFGIATYPDDANSIDSLISAADKAMYEVKRSSKNGVYAASMK